MKFLVLWTIVLSVVVASLAGATLRCRTSEGRIYIGPEPPVGCRIEATYGTGSEAPAPSAEAERRDHEAPATVDAEPSAAAHALEPPSLEPAPGVVEAPRRSRKDAEERGARLPRSPRARRPAPEDERSEVQRALFARRAEMESAIDQALLEIARLRREIELADPPPAPRSGASAEEIRARLRREAEYQRAIEPLRSETAALRARINGIRAEFAELTSRIATAHGGTLPTWWPAALRCNRCPREAAGNRPAP